MEKKNILMYTTDIKEEVFLDPHDSEGTNRTWIYSLRMIIDRDAKELIPLEGLRIKLQYNRMNNVM